MKSIILTFALLLAVPLAYAKLQVVATLPDLGSVATRIGGDRVEVTVLAKPTEDSHFVDPKPSLILKLNRADALIEGGADLEAGWLPTLLDSARNPRIQPGTTGRISVASAIQLLEVPTSLSRAEGDIHAKGNPHFMMDPERAIAVAGCIAEAFATLDPPGAVSYRERLGQFQGEVRAGLIRWQAALAPFAVRHVAAYHNSWVYLGDRFGLKIDLFLEPKPGISPSPSHLVKVIENMKALGVRAILVEPFHDRKTAEFVAQRTGATVVIASQFPNGLPGTPGYVELIDVLITRLAAAMKGGG